MLIGVVAEKDPQEKRVAASPETVKKFIALGAEAVVESGAGIAAGIPDADFAAAGARIGSAADALARRASFASPRGHYARGLDRHIS